MNTLPSHRDVEVVLAPTISDMQDLSLQINRRIFKWRLQVYWIQAYGRNSNGASSLDADYVIIGHSERRYIFVKAKKRYSAESSGGNSIVFIRFCVLVRRFRRLLRAKDVLQLIN